MVKMIPKMLCSIAILIGFAMVSPAQAVWVHYFECNTCHTAGALLYDLDNNLCQTCHNPTDEGTTKTLRGGLGNSNPIVGAFTGGDNSDRLGGVAPVYNSPMQTSHIFASKDTKASAGALPASSQGMYSRYGVGRGYVYCARCHLPHDDTSNPQLLRLGPGSADAMCLDCHRSWDVSGNSGLETHPMVADYNASVTAEPTKFNASITNVNNGGIKLVNGGVSCTSCHGVHFVDSDSTTGDGMLNSATLNPSDGTLLLSDGPSRTGGSQNATAQLRSNLCQSCHTYKMHGKEASSNRVGCLDCHGGHSYNGGTPSAYVLNDVTPSAVPTHIDGVPSGLSVVSFPAYPTTPNYRTTWSDDTQGTANGYCEKCHGDVQDPVKIGSKALEHLQGDTNQCTVCHLHQDPAEVHSFNVDASAATCGACHGFPPYLNAAGNRDSGGTNGGYAFNDVDAPNYNYSADSGHFKDESKTAHKTHAGADLGTNPGEWYFVGNAGIENCQPCHGDNAGSTAGGHRILPGTDPNTFRNVPFNHIATHDGAFTPVFNTGAGTCSNVYCHTNGLPRTGDGPTRSLAGTNVTPVWVGTGANYGAGGYGSIFLQAGNTRCSDCHGNTAASMTTKGNTAAHGAHLGGGSMGVTFGCDVCHVSTAASGTSLAVGATDGRTGGTHVNSQVDVAYNTAGTVLNGALATNAVGTNYDMVTGTCSVYCHDPADTGNTADWDSATAMQCDTCHGGTLTDIPGDGGVGPISTGSHTRHFNDINGPQLACSACHGPNADLGTHFGHLDGIVDVIPETDSVNFNSICEECHGYDAELGEVLPVWGNPGTTDCATCHSGLQSGADINGRPIISLDYARTSGHNRLTASGNYAQSTNPAANNNCNDCHITNSSLHWNGATDSLLLRTDLGFPATYAGNEDSFCANCHGVPDASHSKEATATTGINTHQAKACAACHNVHGTINIMMVYRYQADQVAADQSATGKYAANVLFTNVTNFSAGNLDSYDEDDGAVGATGEANGDDICATCHTSAAGTAHNNSNNTDSQAPGGHNIGSNCFTCHATHTDATNPFGVAAGTACDDCHGFPPATGAHTLHSESASTDKDVEDRTDCAVCHTGADSYTYDIGADQGGALNHSNAAGRKTILAGTVGYDDVNLNCTTACHASSVGDGAWNDANGLNCNACHYAALSPTSAGNVTASNSEAVSAVHNEHFDKGKTCSDCHDVSYSPTITGLAGPLAHITDISGANEGAMYTGMAAALQDEAAVARASMTFDDGLNTCSGSGIGLGCHASGTPDWDIVIPATSAGCVMCHTNTDNATFNPTSGLHDNSPAGPTVTGNSHDGSFDDGSAGTADCITCHSASPTVVAANHINGTLNTGTAITVQAIAGYNQGAATCATTCHSAGTAWDYKWATSAYNTDGTECANCHGDYTSGWNTGVAPHTENPTRGSKHNTTGTQIYPCTDCHAIGSASGYPWTDGTNDWATEGTTLHGNDKITMNQVAGTNTFAIDTVPNPDRAGCTTASCHSNDAAHTLRVTTTAFTTETVTGNAPSIACSSCHGGYVGTNANGYWPDGTLDEDTAGAHQKHITALAAEVYSETLAQLLTDNTAGNPGLTSDAKQKELCSYCHNTPGADGDHGIVANLPAEVNGMYTMWTKAADNGVYSIAADTCATVDCHFNKTTPDNTFGWYDGNTSTCVMCHVDVTAQAAHTVHTGAAATFGRSIGCADCHDAATNWGSNTPPASGHLNNTYTVSGSVAFTYSANTCGTNDCHNNGAGGVPADNSYTWGASLADCTICHAGTPATGAHAVHVANTSYVANSCDDCHAAATAATHINTSVTYAAEISAAPGNGSCTNTCHIAGDAGDWTGGTSALACTDCHSGTGGSAYIGGDKSGVAGPNNMPQFGMHTLTSTVAGVVHNNNIAGAGGSCAFCHDSMPAPGGTHVNGTLVADGPANTDRGMFAGFSDGATPTCTTACHSAGTNWTYKWSATAANSDGTECANCHGDYTSGWNTGVGHATNPTRGNGTHTDVGTLTYECTGCHVIGATTGNYPWTSGTNDWASEGTTLHGNNTIEINNYSATLVRSGTAGCTGCHASNDGSHDFPISSFPYDNTVVGDVEAAGGSCDGCHGNQSGNFWPDGNTAGAGVPTADDQAGKHPQHMAALMAKGIAQADACGYCHGPETGSGAYHNNGTATLPQHSAGAWFYKRIIGGANDTDGVFAAGTNSCSNIDCHFNNAVTPHWYDDTIAPAQVTLTAVAGPEPRSIKVSWTAPGDDNNLANTTPYVYDLRIGSSSAIATNFGLTTNYAGNLPAAYAQGYTSEAVIRNLDIGSTYWFSLKTRDTVGNWSTASTAVSATPAGDTTPPEFGGADKATTADKDATINLTWTPAEDHSMPLTYKVYAVAEGAGSGPGGSLLMGDGTGGTDAPILSGATAVKGHHIQLTAADGIVNDTIYNLGVRACDSLGNCDTNNQVVSATPTALPIVPKTYHSYVTSGSLTLVKDGSPGAAVLTQALPKVFTTAANQTYQTTFFADTFACYVTGSNSGDATVRATVGYSTNGTNFTSLGVFKDITVAKRAKRVYSFKIGDVITGVPINAGQRFAIQISEVTTPSLLGVTINYGDSVNRGDVTVAERNTNSLPTNPAVNATVTGADVNITWTTSTDTADGVADTVHYDLYGSDDNGATYRYLLATDLPAGTTNYTWNTQEDGISGAATCAVKLTAGDGYDHFVSTKTGLAVDNSSDNVAPGQITDLVAEVRPKNGSVRLTWTAPGDDDANNGRAAYYDIRYSTSAINDGNFASATETVNEPSPDFGGHIQEFEVTGLTPGTPYFFAIKTYDEGGNGSLVSTAKAAGTDQAVGGPRCGMCHTTAPSVTESVGNHKLHGFTINDCTNCHGAAVASYTLAHQDGQLVMGYGPGGAFPGNIAGNRIYYTNDGTPGGTVLYDDTDGFGGFGAGFYASVGDGIDNGTCMNFGALGVGGCHGPAGTDPDAGGPLPTYATPNWNQAASLDCAQCHGNPSRTTDSVYGRDFDGTVANGSVVPDQILGAPLVDNHGNYNPAAATEAERKYIGQHEKHLNYSFRFSKGDSCNLCHKGDYADRNDLDGRHANGDVDVELDLVAAGPNATWNPGTPTTAGSCSNMSPETCHPSASTPAWDSTASFDCVGCHGFGGTTPTHVTDPANGIIAVDNAWGTDPMAGNCTYCHFGGHPRTDEGGTALILANSSQVGISYRSGGIHLKKSPGAHAGDTNGTHNTAYASEAQLCWGCHDQNGISEWGIDNSLNDGAANNIAATVPANASNYNYGSVTTSNWTTATWTSGDANFGYKTGAIKSTHSTNELGTSTVTGGMKARIETVDAVANIRCSNCHDVHNLNKAPGDTMTGAPYLRGTWMRNPYPEDGAPWNKSYGAQNKYGAVPRGGTLYNEQGGYQIDQNNGSPTAGKSLASTGGICTLCHGTDINAMDKKTGESFWVGTNGHTNSALGGTGSVATNIFGDGIGGRPNWNYANLTGTARNTAYVYNMGANMLNTDFTPSTSRGHAYRSKRYTAYNNTQAIRIDVDFAYIDFDWGVSMTGATPDVGYHAFSCSKCHTPHASRLPKLMITNCLDTSHNTWDDNGSAGYGLQSDWTSVTDNGETTSTWSTAQNCHRYDSIDSVGGWNLVTPW